MSKQTLELILNELEHKVEKEVLFAKELKRKFRADYIIYFENNTMIKGIIVEYNGLNFQNSNKSRHTNAMGFIKDMEKLNIATQLGYLVLQYNVKALEDPSAVKNQILAVLDYYDKEITVDILEEWKYKEDVDYKWEEVLIDI